MTTVSFSKFINQSIGYNEPLKASFHKEAKKALKLLADKLGLGKGEYDLRSNMGGIAVSGEITLHTDTLYIQISQGFNGLKILYRTCKGRKDYSGGANNYAPIEKILDDDFVSRLKALSSR